MIPELGPSARATAFAWTLGIAQAQEEYGAGGAAIPSANASLAKLLGPLASDDAYYVPRSITTTWTEDDPNDWVANLFDANLNVVRTFITNARYDQAILSSAIPALFAQAGLGGQIDDAPRDGVARPGWFDVLTSAAGTVEVRFPSTPTAGTW